MTAASAWARQATEKFAEQAEIVRSRGRPDFPIAYIGVDDKGDRARKHVANELRTDYGNRSLEDVAVARAFKECVRGVQEVIEAGAQLVLFTMVADPDEQMELAADCYRIICGA
ncbi:hypothetical protein [Streptomyces sp. NPDC005374]|uniref:hypothetical protein n=1 Tax=Streptomyces sp. NPDC005374 TaxID=3364713 RepID=UPI0036BE75E2